MYVCLSCVVVNADLFLRSLLESYSTGQTKHPPINTHSVHYHTANHLTFLSPLLRISLLVVLEQAEKQFPSLIKRHTRENVPAIRMQVVRREFVAKSKVTDPASKPNDSIAGCFKNCGGVEFGPGMIGKPVHTRKCKDNEVHFTKDFWYAPNAKRREDAMCHNPQMYSSF
jgi:hypothetical protein